MQNLQAGIFPPYWCPAINNGLGLPIFVFYFLIPYLPSVALSLLIPQMDYYNILALSAACFSLLGGATAFAWLKDIFPQKIAVLCALLFVFLPYRTELLFWRYAYAEFLFLAIMPLLFKYTRQLIQNERAAFWKLIFWAILCLPIHVQAGVIAAIGIGLYALIMANNKTQAISIILLIGLCAFCFSSALTVPAIYYQGFMTFPTAQDLFDAYPNRHMELVDHTSRRPVMNGTFFELLTISVLGFIYFRKSTLVNNSFIRKEMVAYAAIMLVSLLIFLPVSKIFYEKIPFLANALFPWRVQLLWCFVLTYFAGVYMTYLLSPKKQKNLLFDFSAGMIMLIMLYISIIAYTNIDSQFFAYRVRYTYEIRPKWSKAEYFSVEKLQQDPQKTFFYPLEGKSQSQLVTKTPNSVEFNSDCKSPTCTVQLHLQYFPTWRFADQDGGYTIRPAKLSGKTLITVPQGKHTVHLTHSVFNESIPWYVRYTPYLSMVSLLAWIAAFLYTRKHALPKHTAT